MVVYFLVMENLIQFEKEQTLKVYVHSSLGKAHERYLMKQVSQIQGFFHSQLDIQLYGDQWNKNECKKYCFLLTTEKVPEISATNQFLISDFVSVTDFVRVIMWLSEKTAYLYI